MDPVASAGVRDHTSGAAVDATSWRCAPAFLQRFSDRSYWAPDVVLLRTNGRGLVSDHAGFCVVAVISTLGTHVFGLLARPISDGLGSHWPRLLEFGASIRVHCEKDPRCHWP